MLVLVLVLQGTARRVEGRVLLGGSGQVGQLMQKVQHAPLLVQHWLVLEAPEEVV